MSEETTNTNLTEAETRRMLYDGKLIQYQSQYAGALHSDRLAGDIGIFFLKALLIAHGGALALLAAAYFGESSKSGFLDEVPGAAAKFLFGLASALLCAGFAYFYQTSVTSQDWNDFHTSVKPGSSPPFPWADTATKIFGTIMFTAGIVSFTAFIYAAIPLVGALKPSERSENEEVQLPTHTLSNLSQRLRAAHPH